MTARGESLRSSHRRSATSQRSRSAARCRSSRCTPDVVDCGHLPIASSPRGARRRSTWSLGIVRSTFRRPNSRRHLCHRLRPTRSGLTWKLDCSLRSVRIPTIADHRLHLHITASEWIVDSISFFADGRASADVGGSPSVEVPGNGLVVGHLAGEAEGPELRERSVGGAACCSQENPRSAVSTLGRGGCGRGSLRIGQMSPAIHIH